MRLSSDPATLAALETFAGTVRITAVEAIPFAVPYRRQPEFASGSVSSADNVLVRVHTDAGLVGQAEAQPRPYTYGETQASIVDAVGGALNEALVGRRPAAHRARRRALRGGRGQLRRARRRRPRRLGPRRRRSSAVRATRCWAVSRDDVAAAHMVSFGEPAAMADEAIEVNERLGVTTFKVKVGRAPALDVAAVRAVREALPDADLYVDANRGWSYDDAVRAGDALVELGVRAIEEPISVDDRAGRLRLAERWAVPLGGDESCISLAHVDRALEEGAVRVVSVKTARTGFTESRRILDLCLARNVPVVVGSQYEGGDRRAGDDRVRRRRSPPPPASRPRSRTSSTSRRSRRRRRPRSATAARRVPRRAGPRLRGRRGAPAALPGGPLMLFMAEMEVRLPPDMPAEQADELKAREREYSQALAARRALAASVARGRPLRERERARRRLGRRAARAARPACRCSRTWTSASRRWRATPTPSTEEESRV